MYWLLKSRSRLVLALWYALQALGRLLTDGKFPHWFIDSTQLMFFFVVLTNILLLTSLIAILSLSLTKVSSFQNNVEWISQVNIGDGSRPWGISLPVSGIFGKHTPSSWRVPIYRYSVFVLEVADRASKMTRSLLLTIHHQASASRRLTYYLPPLVRFQAPESVNMDTACK